MKPKHVRSCTTGHRHRLPPPIPIRPPPAGGGGVAASAELTSASNTDGRRRLSGQTVRLWRDTDGAPSVACRNGANRRRTAAHAVAQPLSAYSTGVIYVSKTLHILQLMYVLLEQWERIAHICVGKCRLLKKPRRYIQAISFHATP